ncbi:MAG: hypothetical protein ACYDER_03520 [Ktedonobacteraceae bacterium]
MFRKSLLTILLIAVASGLFLTGCNADPSGIVTITYKQVGACNGYVNGNEAYNAGPNAAYVIFAVQQIDNSSGTQDFAFDPNKLLISGRSSNQHIDTNLSLVQLLAPRALVPTTIPKGNVVPIDGFGVAVVTTSAVNGASEANKTSYDLTMPASGGFGFLFIKSNNSQSSWPDTENCRSITYSTN